MCAEDFVKKGKQIFECLNGTLAFYALRTIVVDVVFPSSHTEQGNLCKQKALILIAWILRISETKLAQLEVMLKEKQSVRKIRELLKK